MYSASSPPPSQRTGHSGRSLPRSWRPVSSLVERTPGTAQSAPQTRSTHSCQDEAGGRSGRASYHHPEGEREESFHTLLLSFTIKFVCDCLLRTSTSTELNKSGKAGPQYDLAVVLHVYRGALYSTLQYPIRQKDTLPQTPISVPPHTHTHRTYCLHFPLLVDLYVHARPLYVLEHNHGHNHTPIT